MVPTRGFGNVASSRSGTGNIPPSSGSLQYYMNHVYSNQIEPTDGPQPHFSARPSSGLLDHDRVNRVLLFDGCFDPPHIAHLRLLEYIFTQARIRLNIVGAIILPSSDHSCNTVARNCKNRSIWNNEPLSEGHDIHFQLAERMKLWYEDPDFPAWASVLDIGVWDAFRDQLVKATTFDGYELRFTLLRGVDHLRLGMRVFHAFKADEMITSDITKQAEFVTKDGLLSLGEDATPWTVWDVKKSLEAARNITIPEEGGIMSTATMHHRLTRGRIEVAPFYFCRANETEDVVLFIPKPEGENDNEYRGVSSTHVRNLMKVRQIDPHVLTGEVASLVLGAHRRQSCL
ncbi:hypothetical protein EG328_006368 [Venturia inaequalis]|uniref:Cytidyltransferase-like domain-containing protein n=1 Tax=Venturia inaequalis TaxID=5025 RepID=A0A8H3UJC7_VENIN|nr:hypothetical protein EG328_006368 [Venturia inaequalis]